LSCSMLLEGFVRGAVRAKIFRQWLRCEMDVFAQTFGGYLRVTGSFLLFEFSLEIEECICERQ
jgi:hypothetical protein